MWEKRNRSKQLREGDEKCKEIKKTKYNKPFKILIMQEELQLFNDYRQAISDLLEQGSITQCFVTTSEGTFIKVSINIDGVEHSVKNVDLVLAVIQLKNKI